MTGKRAKGARSQGQLPKMRVRLPDPSFTSDCAVRGAGSTRGVIAWELRCPKRISPNTHTLGDTNRAFTRLEYMPLVSLLTLDLRGLSGAR